MATRQRILTIDRNQRNLELLSQFLGKEGFDTLPVSTFEGLDTVINEPNNIALALIDISGFDRDIWKYCEKLSKIGVQLLVISARQSPMIQQESLSHGAHGVLIKPLVVKELTSLLHSMLRDSDDE